MFLPHVDLMSLSVTDLALSSMPDKSYLSQTDHMHTAGPSLQPIPPLGPGLDRPNIRGGTHAESINTALYHDS